MDYDRGTFSVDACRCRRGHVRTVDTLVNDLAERLQVKNAARDQALVDSRQIIRRAANAIRALHRGEYQQAEEHLQSGQAMVEATRQHLANHPDLYWAGYVQDAQKEIAEAHLVGAMIRGLPF